MPNLLRYLLLSSQRKFSVLLSPEMKIHKGSISPWSHKVLADQKKIWMFDYVFMFAFCCEREWIRQWVLLRSWCEWRRVNTGTWWSCAGARWTCLFYAMTVCCRDCWVIESQMAWIMLALTCFVMKAAEIAKGIWSFIFMPLAMSNCVKISSVMEIKW